MSDLHRIYVDLQAAQSTAHAERGIARYSVGLTLALLRLGAPVDTIALSPHLPAARGLPDELASSPLLRTRSAQTLADAAERGPVAYHVMSPIELELPTRRTIPEVACVRADAMVAVVHDLIPLVFADRYLRDPHLREAYRARLTLLRQFDLLLANSEHTRRDVLELAGVAPERVVTIGGGVSPFFSPASDGDDATARVRAKLPEVDRPFLLCVSGWEWRKNTESLIRAFARMPRSTTDHLQLVVACSLPPEGVAAWRDVAETAGLRPSQLVLTGYVDDALLRDLYRAATLFVFPSRYEGFGLPVAEAARCGTPVVTSCTSSLPEIIDAPESTFDPDDVDEMATVVDRAVTDEQFRRRLRDAAARAAQVHTWDNVAQRTVDAYRRLPPPRRTRRRRVHRVAFIGPLPPTASGVATYNARVLAALDEPDLDVHVVVEGLAPGAPRPRTDRRVVPVEAFDRDYDLHDYDVVVYTIGNQVFHVRTFELALQHPGIVWLHDASLVGLHLTWAQWRARSGRSDQGVLDQIRDEIVAAYGDAAPIDRLLAEPFSHRPFVDHGVHLTARLARGARHLVVNSSVAADMVRDDVGPDAAMPPMTIVPHAVPSFTDLGRQPAGDAPLVVALGVVDAMKRPDVLVEAVARLGRDVDLAFVGPWTDDARTLVDAAARRCGIAGRVTITGRVDDRSYLDWLARADVVVQLRDSGFGESSGPVHDAIGAGVPVVTSVPSCRDLPPNVVERVATDASPEVVRDAIARVLSDPSRAAAMREAGRAYAETRTFARVASEIADVVRRTVAARR
ncbi:MAG TPA: glycosyltransferase [Acidimicrobiales bacterium]